MSNAEPRRPGGEGPNHDLSRRNDAIVSICLWLSASLIVGAAMWPVSKQPLSCYLRSTDLDLIGIGGVAAGFSWLLRLNERKRVVSLAIILGVLGIADYFHLGGSDILGLVEALAAMFVPLFMYVWLVDPSPIFDLLTTGPPPIPILVAIRRGLQELGGSSFFIAPLGGTMLLLVISLALVAFVPHFFPDSHLVLEGRCNAISTP